MNNPNRTDIGIGYQGLVSVIVTVYNKASYLKKCIDSIENNSYKNLEIILVEDCSTDNSMDVIHALMETYPNITLLQNPTNLGAGLSRDRGVKHANGEWISFIDADDYINPDYYETYFRRMSNDSECKDVDIIFSECNVVYEWKDTVRKSYGRENKIYTDMNFCIENLTNLKFQFLNIALIRKSLFNNIDYCHSRFIEDTPTSYLLLFNAKNIQTINYAGYNYLQLKSSLIHTHRSYVAMLYFCYNMIPVIEYIQSRDEALGKKLFDEINHTMQKYAIRYAKDYDDLKPVFNEVDKLMEYFNLSKEYMTEQKELSNKLTKTRVVRVR